MSNGCPRAAKRPMLATAYPRAAVACAFSASMWKKAGDSLATTPGT